MNSALKLDNALRLLKEDGEQYLTDSEILALTLEVSVETADKIIEKVGSFDQLKTANWFTAVAQLKLSDAQTRRLKAALSFSRRINENRDLVKIQSPADAYEVLRPLIAHKEQEHLVAILLDNKTRIKKVETIYIGTTNSAPARIGEIFRTAVRVNAIAVIVAHNHPSQDPTPSPEDVQVTKQMVAAGKLIQVDLLDHIIVCENAYVSLKDRNLGF